MKSVWDIHINPNISNISNDLLTNVHDFFINNKQNLTSSYKDFENEHIIIDEESAQTLTIKHNDENIYFYSLYLDIHKEKYNILEKYVYDITKFHFDRLGLEITDDYTIEYFLINEFNKNRIFHYDHDEIENVIYKKRDSPFLVTLTYFNDSIYPTVISNIEGTSNVGDVNYEVNNDETLFISFPKSGKHIVFDGGYLLHESTNIFNKKLTIDKMKGIHIERYAMNVQFYNTKKNFKPYLKISNKTCDEFDKNSDFLLFTPRSQDQIKIVDNVSQICMKEYFQMLRTWKIDYNSHYVLEPLLNAAGYQKNIYNTFVLTTLQADDVKLYEQLSRINGEENARKRTE